MATGFRQTAYLHAACALELADALHKNGPSTAAELATLTDTRPGPLGQLLRALARGGVFMEVAGQRFANNNVSAALRKDVEGSLYSLVMHFSDPAGLKVIETLAVGLKGGGVPFDLAHGQDLRGYYESHADSAAWFNQAMVDLARSEGAAVAKGYDWGRFGSLMDLGGGFGGTLKLILDAHPGLVGYNVDLASVVQQPEKVLQHPNLSHYPGNFFESLPNLKPDAILMKYVLHDWSDEESVRILGNVAPLLDSGNELFLCERVVAEHGEAGGPRDGSIAASDMWMWTLCGGKERTKSEWEALLNPNGFTIKALLDIPGMPNCRLIQAVKN